MAEVKLTDEQLETVAGGNITISYGGKTEEYTSSNTVGDVLKDFPDLGTKWPVLKTVKHWTVAYACAFYKTDEAGLQKMINDKLSE